MSRTCRSRLGKTWLIRRIPIKPRPLLDQPLRSLHCHRRRCRDGSGQTKPAMATAVGRPRSDFFALGLAPGNKSPHPRFPAYFGGVKRKPDRNSIHGRCLSARCQPLVCGGAGPRLFWGVPLWSSLRWQLVKRPCPSTGPDHRVDVTVDCNVRGANKPRGRRFFPCARDAGPFRLESL